MLLEMISEVRRRLAVFPCLFLLLASCSQAVGTVTGKVTLTGSTPVPSGRVLFCYPNNAILTADITKDARYTIKDAPAGPVKVCVMDLTGTENTPARLAKDQPPPALAPRMELIPKKYQNPENGLTYSVKSGSQT